MPTEIRHLLFSETELSEAIRDYYQRSGQLLPVNARSVLKIDKGDQPFVRVAADTRRAEIDIKVKGEELLASLIFFCHKRRIPLPARGSKELAVLNGRLAVVIKLPMQPALKAQVS